MDLESHRRYELRGFTSNAVGLRGVVLKVGYLLLLMAIPELLINRVIRRGIDIVDLLSKALNLDPEEL